MVGQYEILSCPFCKKGEIQCLYFPGAVSEQRRKTASLPGGKSFHKSAETWIIQSGCKVCGKTEEEVEKELRKQGNI